MRLAPRSWTTVRDDSRAGLVLGVQSVPDGLATGLLAGLNPVSGLHAYMIGTLAGAIATSSAFMVVQSTGAMAMIIADVDVLHDTTNQAALVATLSLLTGAVMIGAGLLRLGRVLRFVSNAVMVGFMSAVGVNIVLGQLANLTGYAAPGDNRITRTINTVLSPTELSWPSLAAGAATVTLILVLERTRVGSLGLVIAVIVVSAAVAVLDSQQVATLSDLGVDANGLPTFTLPSIGDAGLLILPAFALAFVALVQGAGISATYRNADGRRGDASRDFTGQGLANVASSFGGGMPVGGSASASALNVAAGARTRLAPAIAAVVMVLVILVFGGAIGYIALPSLAGLLILIGARTVNRDRIVEVWSAGVVQRLVLLTTFVLTMVLPLQYAVVAGVALSFVLYVVSSSNQLQVRQRVTRENGDLEEVEPPAQVPPGEVILLQVYGSLFFASATVFVAALPDVDASSGRSVVILRLRGQGRPGTTVMQALRRYGKDLAAARCRLMVVAENPLVVDQLARLGVTEVIGADSVYVGDHRVGNATAAAVAAAHAWIATESDGPPTER